MSSEIGDFLSISLLKANSNSDLESNSNLVNSLNSFVTATFSYLDKAFDKEENAERF